METYMQIGDKVAIVACSNGLARGQKIKIQELCSTLMGIGLIPILSKCIYAKDSVFSGSGQERAECLMKFYQDDEIKAIYDISGGDIANEVLPYLDFEMIRKTEKQFWGYSDLTTLLNAIYAKTGQKSVLYQVRNLMYEHAEKQRTDFVNTVLKEGKDLFEFSYEFVQKEHMQGVIVGGNIRCLLKLAGTEYWPDMKGKILLLEAYGGGTAQMTAYLSQLKQMNVFRQISGILLGTFTKMEMSGNEASIVELVKRYAGEEIPIVRTKEVGHGTDSKAVLIGKEVMF